MMMIRMSGSKKQLPQCMYLSLSEMRCGDLTVPWSLSLDMMMPRPVSAVGSVRPTSVFAKMAARTGDPRYMVRSVSLLVNA